MDFSHHPPSNKYSSFDLVLTAVERGIKISKSYLEQRSYSEQNVWNDNIYMAFYYMRFLLSPIFYGAIISFCLRIVDPSFYRPNKWLK